MTTWFEIPLASIPESFVVSLNGNQYRLTFTWCAPAQTWMMDIYNSDGTPLLLGSPLVTGADLLQQYAYLSIGGNLVVQSDHSPFVMPTFTNLGSASHLYYGAPI